MVRRSISVSAETESKIRTMARQQNRSTAKVLENLVETGLAAKEAEKRRFFEVAERLRATTDESEVQRLKQELARMTFGG